MFCDSDQASLCWDCDEKVHAANFLVAKHSRTLLCHVCYSPTPWKAAGPKLGATVSVCHACARRGRAAEAVDDDDDDDGDERAAPHRSQNGETNADDREYYSSESDDSSEEDEYEDEDEDGENQVVPWSGASASNSPPAASTSSEEENVSSTSSMKRTRDDAFALSEVINRPRIVKFNPNYFQPKLKLNFLSKLYKNINFSFKIIPQN